MTNNSSEKSTYNRVELTKTDNYLSVYVPPNRYNYGSIFSFAVVLFCFMSPWLFLKPFSWYAVIPFWLGGSFFCYRTLICYFAKTEFYVDRQTINRRQWLFGRPCGKVISIPSYGIMSIRLYPPITSGGTYSPQQLVVVYDRERINLIGNLFDSTVVDNLADDETLEWLCSELRQWLATDRTDRI